MLRRVLRALALVASLIGLACGGPEAPPGAPNVLLLLVDTLRPDFLGCYGHTGKMSPAMDALAARGTLFETAVTTAPWTKPAVASLLTGLSPSRHGVVLSDQRLPDDVPTLAERLADAGYTTAAFVNSRWLTNRHGLDRGFQDFAWERENVRRRKPSGIAAEAAAWLAAPPPEPFLLFLHFYDVHSDYASLPRYEREFTSSDYSGAVDGSTAQLRAVREGRMSLGPGDASQLAALYSAGVRQMDDVIGHLLSALGRTGLAERTVVILTSDHGEEFLEHGSVLHGRAQFEEVMRIPLILAGPGVPAGRRVSRTVSIIDVAPTVLRLAGLPAVSSEGVDLRTMWEAPQEAGGEPRAFFGEADWRTPEDDVTRSVRLGHVKLLHDRLRDRTQLYDLETDPAERRDLSASNPDLVRDLRARLDAHVATRRETRDAPDFTPEEVERLRALGYLDSEPAGD